MKIFVYKNTCARNGIPIIDKFINSCNENIIIKEHIDNEVPDLIVMWSVLWTNQLRKQIWDRYYKKIPILIFEVGGLIRNKTWRIGLNGINRFANYGSPKLDNTRPDKLGLKFNNINNNKENIIICGQNRDSGSVGKDIEERYINSIEQILKYNKQIIYRPHPRYNDSIDFLNKLKKYNVMIQNPQFVGNYDDFDLKNQLNNCFLLVNYNSNPAIEAVLNNVPVLVHESSHCYNIIDKNEWLIKISHIEWLEEEIEKGIPWNIIKNEINVF